MRTLLDRMEPSGGWTPKRKIIAWVVITVLIIVFTFVWTAIVNKGVDAIPSGKAEAPLVYHSTGNAARFRTTEIVVRRLPARIPPNEISPAMLALRFQSGQMRNSHGILLPANVRAAIAAKNPPRTFWRKTLNTGACVSNLAVAPINWTCVTYRQWNNDRQYLAWKQMTKIKVSCGGAAIFGYVSGSWKGAMIGGLSCGWSSAVALW